VKNASAFYGWNERNPRDALSGDNRTLPGAVRYAMEAACYLLRFAPNMS